MTTHVGTAAIGRPAKRSESRQKKDSRQSRQYFFSDGCTASAASACSAGILPAVAAGVLARPTLSGKSG